MGKHEPTDAEKELSIAWFIAMEELRSTALLSETTVDRIRASEALLNYCIALGQSINTPFMPSERPKAEETDDDD